MKRKARGGGGGGEEEEEEEEEEEGLLISACKVVEYLEPVMSKELLVKFPDNSAYDFDYTQSSIWSPLVPRVHAPLDLDLGSVSPRKLTCGFGSESDDAQKKNKKKKKKASCRGSSIKKSLKMMKKKKMAVNADSVGFNFNLNFLKMKQSGKKKVLASDFSPTPIMGSCVPFATKGWNKVLKAASMHFKKKKMKEPAVHVKLSNYIKDAGN